MPRLPGASKLQRCLPLVQSASTEAHSPEDIECRPIKKCANAVSVSLVQPQKTRGVEARRGVWCLLKAQALGAQPTPQTSAKYKQLHKKGVACSIQGRGAGQPVSSWQMDAACLSQQWQCFQGELLGWQGETASAAHIHCNRRGSCSDQDHSASHCC